MIVIALIICIGFAVQATAGFGAGLLVMSLGAHFWPISELMMFVASLSMMLSLYICIRDFRHVEFRMLLRSILPTMGLGVLVGLLVSSHISPDVLRILLGVVVSAAAARGLYSLFSGKTVVAKRGGYFAYVWVVSAGVVHALIVSGGPLLVYAIESMGLGKDGFRASLALVWFSFNSILVTHAVSTGTYGAALFAHVASLVPALVIATLIGQALHSRVSEHVFRAVVFVLLAVAGVLLWLPQLLG